MNSIHELATVTSKGQITLPKPIRKALGVDVGGKVAFDLRGSQVVVSRAETQIHADPAIAGFLTLLEQDIQTGRRLTDLPDHMVQSMLLALKSPIDLEDDIIGDVAL